MRNENIFVLLAIIALAIFLVVAKFSSSIGVNFETGLAVVGRSLGVLVIAYAISKAELFPVSVVISAACSGLVWAFFPAIDFWSAQAVGDLGFVWDVNEAPWWSRWYSKVGYMLVPAAGGYGFWYFTSR